MNLADCVRTTMESVREKSGSISIVTLFTFSHLAPRSFSEKVCVVTECRLMYVERSRRFFRQKCHEEKYRFAPSTTSAAWKPTMLRPILRPKALLKNRPSD